MNNDRLTIKEVEKKRDSHAAGARVVGWRQEIQARMERLWLQDPSQFDSERDVIQRRRIEQTSELLLCLLTERRSVASKVVDLGCGSGLLTRYVRDLGFHVDAVDIAGNALALLKMGNMERIRVIQDALPSTSLPDDAYDLVMCTEVIGFVPQQMYRLFFSELSRLVSLTGHVVCSTEFDLNSEGGLARFNGIAETEFAIESWIFGYHRLFLRCCHFFEAPEQWCNFSGRVGCLFWRGIAYLTSPIGRWLRQNKAAMLFCEKVSHFLWQEEGITHALFVGKRRPLTFPLSEEQRPKEAKHKHQLWE